MLLLGSCGGVVARDEGVERSEHPPKQLSWCHSDRSSIAVALLPRGKPLVRRKCEDPTAFHHTLRVTSSTLRFSSPQRTPIRIFSSSCAFCRSMPVSHYHTRVTFYTASTQHRFSLLSEITLLAFKHGKALYYRHSLKLSDFPDSTF